MYLHNILLASGIHFSWLASPGVKDQFDDTQSCLIWNKNTKEYVAFGRIDNDYGRNDVCPGNVASYRNVATSISTTNIINITLFYI